MLDNSTLTSYPTPLSRSPIAGSGSGSPSRSRSPSASRSPPQVFTYTYPGWKNDRKLLLVPGPANNPLLMQRRQALYYGTVTDPIIAPTHPNPNPN